MNIGSEFLSAVRAHGDQPALFYGDEVWTYRRLGELAQAAAAHLRTVHGVRPGDRVALWLRNCPEFVPTLLGALLCDAVVVPVNNFLKPPEVAYILADAEAGVLLSDGAHPEALAAIAAARPGMKVLDVSGLRTWPAPVAGFAGPQRQQADLAVLIYTSGTTGHPKGAMLSHGNLLHNIGSCRRVLGYTPADRFGVILPLFHTYMLTVGLLLPLTTGGSMVLVKSLHQPRALLGELAQHGATILPAIPQFYRTLTHAPVEGKLPFRLCISGAAPLPVQVLKDFEARFGIPLLEGYGLSEASPVVTKNPFNGVRKPGSIGLPIPDVEVSVQDDQGNHLATGVVGEICVRGGNVMLGYWNRPAESATVFRAGWLLTGDIGYRDAEGYYYITDRKKDMLLVNGINVYPREIEEVIYQFPGVRETAVVGVPDERRGEQARAFVVATEGATVDTAALQDFLRERLADYKVPREIMMLPALPRNATGKVLKTALRADAR
jgi:long-chain acyl-CoA synthetase